MSKGVYWLRVKEEFKNFYLENKNKMPEQKLVAVFCTIHGTKLKTVREWLRVFKLAGNDVLKISNQNGLEEKQKQQNGTGMLTCQQCGAVYSSGFKQCPYCTLKENEKIVDEVIKKITKQ